MPLVAVPDPDALAGTEQTSLLGGVNPVVTPQKVISMPILSMLEISEDPNECMLSTYIIFAAVDQSTAVA